MEITTELVSHLATLSRLEFNDEELENFKTEFAKTLEQVDKIEKADTSRVEVKENMLDAETELRQDGGSNCLNVKQAIKNAPDSLGNSVLVPVEIV